MKKSIEKPPKITKDNFIQSVVYKGLSDTNKSIATELGISESYYYKLLRKYSAEIAKELKTKKNSIRLKAISVLEHHLDKKDLRTALAIMRQIDWQDETHESGAESIDLHFKIIAEALMKRGVGYTEDIKND